VSVFTQKLQELPNVLPGRLAGRVKRVVGLLVEVTPLSLPVGSVCAIHSRLSRQAVEAEVVGFREDASLLMALGEMRGVGPGDMVESVNTQQIVAVGPHLLGRVLNGMGQPIDGKGPLYATETRAVYADPPDPVMRPRIKDPLPTGIRAIDGFMTIGTGQRIGIFAGTGVGKSTLMGMITRFSAAEISVIALVGERGREVREFIERELGPEGMKKSVVVVATSDQPAPVRVRCPFVATAIAEYFRDQGNDVALLMDSVTRMAMAQRDIGSSIGEVPSAGKGYPASVFSMLPRLMERSGKAEKGSITGLYTVLVEGDDLNDPIGDASRGILDGHIVLDRSIAEKGHYPAINFLASLSRLQSEIMPKDFMAAARQLRGAAAVFGENEDMINIGAYSSGTNQKIDQAINIMPQLNEFLQQGMDEKADFQKSIAQIKELADQHGRTVTPRRAPPQTAPQQQQRVAPQQQQQQRRPAPTRRAR